MTNTGVLVGEDNTFQVSGPTDATSNALIIAYPVAQNPRFYNLGGLVVADETFTTIDTDPTITGISSTYNAIQVNDQTGRARFTVEV